MKQEVETRSAQDVNDSLEFQTYLEVLIQTRSLELELWTQIPPAATPPPKLSVSSSRSFDIQTPRPEALEDLELDSLAIPPESEFWN